MKYLFTGKSSKSASISLLLFVFAIAPAFSQLPGPAEAPKEKGVFDRISVGLRGSVLLLPINNEISNTTYTSQTDPPLSTLNYSNNASKRFGGGPTVQFDVNPKLSLNVDFLYRRLGYDSGIEVITQNTDEDEGDDNSEWVSGNYERTRGDLWDVPIMVRYYRGPVEDEDGRRAFVAGGVTLRTLSGIRSFNQAVNEDGLSDSNTVPATPLHSTIPGLTAGLGWQFRDEIGVKVDIEVRYTRWLQRFFDSPTGQSNLNQAEVMLGLSF